MLQGPAPLLPRPAWPIVAVIAFVGTLPLSVERQPGHGMVVLLGYTGEVGGGVPGEDRGLQGISGGGGTHWESPSDRLPAKLDSPNSRRLVSSGLLPVKDQKGICTFSDH